MNEANLDLQIRTDPEVDLGPGPNLGSILEGEFRSDQVDWSRHDADGVGSYFIKSEGLDSWMRREVPSAILGVEAKTFLNW